MAASFAERRFASRATQVFHLRVLLYGALHRNTRVCISYFLSVAKKIYERLRRGLVRVLSAHCRMSLLEVVTPLNNKMVCYTIENSPDIFALVFKENFLYELS